MRRKKVAKHTILFDDTCPLCWRSVHKIMAWDKKGIFRFVPLRDPLARAVCGKRYQQLQRANTLVLIETCVTRHTIWIRAQAVLRILWLLGGWRKLIGWLSIVPLLNPVYALVARQRHRFFKKK